MDNEQKLNERLLKWVYPKARIRYNDEEGLELFTPEYIASGKSFRTHMIDAKPVPRFTHDLHACFNHLIPKLDVMFLTISSKQTEAKLRKGDSLDSDSWWLAENQNPALAICLAVEKLIEFEEGHTIQPKEKE